MNNNKNNHGIPMKRSQNRTVRTTIRLTPDEYCDIRNRVPDGIPFASWLRDVALGQPITVRRKKIPDVDPELNRQLQSIGRNINQISRSVNSGAVGMADLMQILIQMERHLDLIRQNHSSEASTDDRETH